MEDKQVQNFHSSQAQDQPHFYITGYATHYNINKVPTKVLQVISITFTDQSLAILIKD